MNWELLSSLLVNGSLFIMSILLILRGWSLRKNNPSVGISASSNNTSTSTTLMVIGGLVFLSQIIKFIQAITQLA